MLEASEGSSSSSYDDWRGINYKPAITDHLPEALLPYLSPKQKILDIGCNTGNVCLFLASLGFAVTGVDINPDAIRTANKRVENCSLPSSVKFICADFTKTVPVSPLEYFAAVLLIRVLTCFPAINDWRRLLQRADSFLKNSGLIYILDFKIAANSPVYQPRYDDGQLQGWRKGNFAVNNETGERLFVAHHHSDDEIKEIISPYKKLELNYKESVSMNGNACEMFEFIGQKSE